MYALIHPVAWLLGLMLAPHTLALLGNLAGQLQWLMSLALAAGVGLYWLNAFSLGHLTLSSSEPASVLDALVNELGELPAKTLFFSGRLMTAVSVSTVLLVTAGFVFNETFVFWFPNFAFAFVLLGLVMSTHLMGAVVARRLQLFCMVLALTGIAVLTLMGLLGSPPPDIEDNMVREAISLRSFLAVSMLLVGFDLAFNHDPKPDSSLTKPMVTGILVAGITLGLWAVVSAQYVTADKLSDTFIAHTLAAKAIGGQSGRMIMGVVIIAGAYAAVNSLFWSQGRSLAQWWSRGRRASKARRWIRPDALGSLLFVGIVAVMMATGMAGTDEIDTYVRTGLYLWMLSYAGLHLAVLLRRHRTPGTVPSSCGWAALLGTVLMTGISVGLIVTDPEWALVLKSGGIVLAMVALLCVLERMLRPRLMVKGNSGPYDI